MQDLFEQFDERDNVFSREDLIHGNSEYDEYYSLHPEFKACDDHFRNLPGYDNQLSGIDRGMFFIPAEFMHNIGFPDVVDGLPEAQSHRITPERATEKVKNYARRLGADMVGISRMEQAFAYSHRGRIKYSSEPWGSKISLNHKYAISMGFRMDPLMIQTGPRPSEMVETGLVYMKSAVTSVILAKYIRGLGYPARAHHFRNYQVLPVPLAVDAGLGELGRCGFLLTKQYGNCLRLSTVTTDLPLECDKPVNIGVQDFCEMCKLCADACPSGAIPHGDKILVRGVKKWQLDAVKCISYWNKVGSDCGMCIGSCPWTQKESWYHKLGSELATYTHLSRVILLKMYPLLYGKYKPRPMPDWIDKKNSR